MFKSFAHLSPQNNLKNHTRIDKLNKKGRTVLNLRLMYSQGFAISRRESLKNKVTTSSTKCLHHPVNLIVDKIVRLSYPATIKKIKYTFATCKSRFVIASFIIITESHVTCHMTCYILNSSRNGIKKASLLRAFWLKSS